MKRVHTNSNSPRVGPCNVCDKRLMTDADILTGLMTGREGGEETTLEWG